MFEGIFDACTLGVFIIYTGLMFAIVWKSFDMTAELKNWVFEWIGGSSRSMGENQGQQQHIMGAVSTAKGAGSQALNSAATSAGGKGNKAAMDKLNQGGGGQPNQGVGGMNSTPKNDQR